MHEGNEDPMDRFRKDRPSGRRRRRCGLPLLAASLLAAPILTAAVSPSATAQVEAPPGPLAPAPEFAHPATVTLITGDQVTVGRDGIVSVDTAPGREGVTFVQQ